MKKSDELKQKRHALIGEIKDLENLNLEERVYNERETALSDKIYKLSGDILQAETDENNRLEKASRSFAAGNFYGKELQKYSFARAIRVAIGAESGGLEDEMNQEAKKEAQSFGKSIRGFGIPSIILNRTSSGQNATTPADGGYLVSDNGMMFFEALRNKLTLTRLGAQFLTGLQGNLPLVGSNTFTAAFAAEGAEISKTKLTFADRGTLTPKRLSALGAVSKELIHQSTAAVDKIIVNELTSAIATAIEIAAINGSGQSPNPTGILNTVGIKSVAIGTNGGSVSWSNVVDLETEVKKANGHGMNMGYLTNSAVIGELKTILKANTEQFLMENNLVNGYSCLDTNAVPSNLNKGTSTGMCSAIIFGAWENLLIGMWGGLDLIVDPYTRKAFGEIEIATNQFIDIGVSNPYHFGALKDILTT